LDQEHSKKGMRRLLIKLIGKSVHYKGISARISKWWMRIVMRVVKEIRAGTLTVGQGTFKFRTYWSHTVRHYSQLPCNPNCPCKELVEGELGVLDDKSTNQVGDFYLIDGQLLRV
jgi:hypothetical protein